MAEHRLQGLTQKYHSVLNALEQQHARVQDVRMEGGKLLIRATVPTAEAKDHVWEQIRLIDVDYRDLLPDITITAAAAPMTATAGTVDEYIDDADRVARPGGAPGRARTYTVQPGDTLPKLAADFYGDANQYMRIFNANRGKLNHPDELRPGQKLIIPGGTAVEEQNL